MKGKYLITTDAWFIAPDGHSYKAAWGEVEIVEDKFLGISTNRNSSNWYAKVGTEDNHIIIAGCQIHYACKCEKRPFMYSTNGWPEKSSVSDKFIEPIEPTKIYVFDDRPEEPIKEYCPSIIETIGKYQRPHSNIPKIKLRRSNTNIPLQIETECINDNCPMCKGTGKKEDGSTCIHHISCNCKKCSISL